MHKTQKDNNSNQRIGEFGENLAAEFLVSRGHSILERNYDTPFGEIDFVTRHKNCVIFIEVKTRRNENFGTPLAAITEIKQQHIIRNCHYYLKRYGLYDTPCRIDAIGITLNNKMELQILRHVKNAVVKNEFQKF